MPGGRRSCGCVEQEVAGHWMKAPRQLNPRRYNDCITYPRLNEIGFCRRRGQGVLDGITVSNLRTPCAVVVRKPWKAVLRRKGILKWHGNKGQMVLPFRQ